MKTVIELHDKYLQVCSPFKHGLSSCRSSFLRSLCHQIRHRVQATDSSAHDEAELSYMAFHGALHTRQAVDDTCGVPACST